MTRSNDLTAIVDDARTFKPDVLRAVKAFARSKPWQGSHEERTAKFSQLNTDLAAAYGVEALRLEFYFTQQNRPNGTGGYSPEQRAIVLAFRLSVVTYLELFGRSLGWNEKTAQAWSLNLFARCFPRSFSGCRLDANGCLVRDLARLN
jgi:hypothetical protein